MPSLQRAARFVLAATCSTILSTTPVAAETSAPNLPKGKKSVFLVTHDGKKTEIGSVTFTPVAAAVTFDLVLDPNILTDNFLSMRNFQCLKGEKRQWCHLPYPYDTRGTINADDLIDLEYALLFLWRTFDRVSADAWNGLYFKLSIAPDGSISGPVNEADFNVMASPPKEKLARPVAHSDLTPAQPGSQEWDSIEIR